MARSIPPNGSIPEGIRNGISTGITAGFLSQGAFGQKSGLSNKSNTFLKKGTRGNGTRENQGVRISPEGFIDKLFWLEEHLAELEEADAPFFRIQEVSEQIEKLEDLLGVFKNARKV